MEENKEEGALTRNEIEKKYRNKEMITEDEFLYVICNFNPDYDSPFALSCYLQRYKDYIDSLSS